MDSNSLIVPPTWVVGDVISAGAIVGVFLGWVPTVAAFVSMLWFSIQVWESKTVQHYVRNKRMIRKAKKIARLRAKEKVIVAQLEALETVRVARAEAREKVAIATAQAAVLVAHENTEAITKLPPI